MIVNLCNCRECTRSANNKRQLDLIILLSPLAFVVLDMSRSKFLTTTKETPTTTSNLRCHSGLMPTSSRANDTLLPVAIVVQASSMAEASSSTTAAVNQHKSIVRLNPKMKRNLRDKRRPTGIRPEDLSLPSTSTEVRRQPHSNAYDFSFRIRPTMTM